MELTQRLSSDKEIKLVLEKRGYTFHTDTDTEAVGVLCKYIYDSQPNKRLNFTDLIKAVIKELVRGTWLGGKPVREVCRLILSSVSFGLAGRFLCVRLQVATLPG
jgi:hypothetical protein